eukprot:6182106-Pleurochrysis_carterae.AAC.1
MRAARIAAYERESLMKVRVWIVQNESACRRVVCSCVSTDASGIGSRCACVEMHAYVRSSGALRPCVFRQADQGHSQLQ